MKRPQHLLIFLFLVPFVLSSCKPHSQIREYMETIQTYPFTDTSYFPIIYKNSHIYPYSRIDGFSLTGQPREWKMVKLENDYTEVYILPELGGKVWGAIDKKTGKEFIYKNDVVKPRDIGLRGPYTSGGIEWNSSIIGHHPGVATPVNYTLFTDDKGTAHCVIGGMDLPSHMQWRIDISLPANTSYFEARTWWYNATPYFQSYYHWSNAALKSAEDLHFYFPGNLWLGHDGISHPWPVDEEGTDRSWYRNNTTFGHCSYHVYGSVDNYFVSYYHDEEFGAGHWSPSYGTLGKKIWLWSLARNGAVWENLLTDTHGQYVEVQAGRMLNQNGFNSSQTPFKQSSFIPYNADSWVERWFPVRETEGVTRVAESGTIHVRYTPEGMRLLFSPVIEVSEIMLVSANGNEISNDPVAMKPSEVLKRTFEDINEDDKLEIFLGGELLYSSEENYIIDRPHKAPTDALDDLYILAQQLENHRSYGKALDTYLELLEKEPLHLDATERVAELYLRRGDLDQANHYAGKVLEINAYLPGANFIYGCIRKAEGNFTDARDGFRWAMRSLEYRSASLQLLSEINLMEGKPELAFDQAEQSLSYNKFNLNSYKIQAISQRIMGNPGGAEEILADILEIDPLDHFALFEKYLLKPASNRLNDFNSSFKSETVKEEYLETGLFYAGLGMHNEAVKVFEQAPDDPVIHYWLAWLNKDVKEKSHDYLEKALETSPEFVFPYRTETLTVLEWASEQHPSWITDYYSALILWHVKRVDEALSLLMKWGDTPDFAPFYHSRAHLQGILSEPALKDMQRALAIDPGQWRIYRELADLHISHDNYQAALALAETGHEWFPENYILDLVYGKCLTLTGNYQKSLDVLGNTEILPYEGEHAGQSIYEHNHLMLACENFKSDNNDVALSHIDQSEAYPENLGSGMPSFPDYRHQNMLRIKIYDRTGETGKSQEAQDAIDAYTRKFGKKKGANLYEQQFIAQFP